MNKNIELALELIEFALRSDVDCIYVLEDLEKILKGEKTSFNKNSYWN